MKLCQFFLAYMRNRQGRPMLEELRSELAEWGVLKANPSPGERDKVQEWRERCLCGDQVLQEDGVTYKARSWHAYDLGTAWQAV